MERLIPAALAVTVAFQLAFRFAAPRRVWPVAIVLIIVGSAIIIWYDRHGFTRTSPYTFALVTAVPAVLSGGVAHLGRATRWPWPATTVAGSVVAIITIIPMWMMSCLLAQALSLPGCKF